MSEELYLLAFGAHPDDAEIGAAGILAAHASRGVRTGICTLTLAELSSNGTPAERQIEAAAAAKILGVSERIQLDLGDRRLRLELKVIEAVVQVIRTYRPTIVLAPSAKDRHPDHEWCYQIVREALFSAGLRNYQMGGAESAPFKPARFYQYMINDTHEPSVVVDVTEVYEQKLQALLAYKSQFQPIASGTDTPLNQGTFIKMIEGRDALFGHRSGVKFAEGLISDVPMLVSTL